MEIISALKPFAVQFSNVENKAYELLKKWDGYMSVDSKGASIFQLTIYHVLKSVLEPTLGKDYFRIYMNNLDHWDFLKILSLRK